VAVQIGYMIDTSCGLATLPYPGTQVAQQFAVDAVAEAVTAEKAGFEGVFLPGRHARGGSILPSPLPFLAAISSATTRIRLGTYVIVLPYYDPRKVAEEVAMLDLLSGGRVTLGVGRGGSWEQDILRSSGLEPSMRTERFAAGVAAIRCFWSGEPVTTTAGGLNYQAATIYPRPVQDPCPIWVGALADAAILRAAELGDAWAVDPFPIEPESWKRRVSMYREAAAKAGKQGKIVLMRDAFLADSRAEAERVYGEVVAEEYRQYWDWGLFAHVPGFESRDNVVVRNLTPHMAIGTAQDCIEDLERCANDYEVDYVVLCSRRPAGPPSAAVQESIRGFGTDVLPKLSDMTTTKLQG
jgi:alkanesulfonate monooxygenase SsuD/methylene tetrahydromethanopterin reductase-like flavin-dependent oxidoreductase (luciferase family)